MIKLQDFNTKITDMHIRLSQKTRAVRQRAVPALNSAVRKPMVIGHIQGFLLAMLLSLKVNGLGKV